MENLLKQLGLESQEILIYLTCLKNHKNTPASLVKQTGLKRSTIYFYLDRLKEKGLIIYRIQGKKKYIITQEPKRTLADFLERQEGELTKKKTAIEKLVPQLEKLAKDKKSPAKVYYLEGKTGAREVIDQAIASKQDLYWLGSQDVILSIFPAEEFYRLMTLRRMRQNTTAYSITDQSILKYKQFYEPLGQFRRTKILYQPIEIPALLGMFANKLAIMSKQNKQINIVLIEDQMMVEIVKLLFMSLWEALPKPNYIK